MTIERWEGEWAGVQKGGGLVEGGREAGREVGWLRMQGGRAEGDEREKVGRGARGKDRGGKRLEVGKLDIQCIIHI